MNLQEFAEKYRLRLSKDECGDPIIPCRRGTSNIYQYSADSLGLMLIGSPQDPPHTMMWHSLRAVCLKAGMVLRQDGDAEGSFSFDPENPEQARTAIEEIQPYRRAHLLSPEQRAANIERLKSFRFAAHRT